MFDFEAITRNYPIDTRRLYREFGRDIAVKLLPLVLAVVAIIAWLLMPMGDVFAAAGLALVGYGIGTVGLARYKYPGGEPAELSVLDFLGDVYASPIEGRNAVLSGELIGRGQAGYRLDADVMIRDDTGLMSVPYRSWLPVLGNLLFAIRNVPDLLGQDVTVHGWLYRSTSSWCVLRGLQTREGDRRGYLHYHTYAGAMVALLLGLGFVAFGFV